MSTEVLSNQEKKFKFPIGAVLMAVYSAWSIVNVFKLFKSDVPIGIVELILILSTIAVTVLLFMKKTNFITAIPFLLLAIFKILNLSKIIENSRNFYDDLYYYYYDDDSLTAGFAYACDVIPEILLSIALISVVLLALSDKLTKSPKKFKKAFTSILCISIGISIALYLINTIGDFGLYHNTVFIGRKIIFLSDFRSIIYMLIYHIAILMSGLWITNPYVNGCQNTNKNKPNEEHYISLGAHICLLLFTFGIWQIVWIYKRTQFTNLVKDEEERNPTTKLLLCLFIPFYNIYWTYKTAKRVDKIAKERNVPSDIGTICLVLAIFIPIIPPILIQAKINEALSGNGSTTTITDNRVNDADLLVKYKELLDQGVITQDDYDAKKKELLGL